MPNTTLASKQLKSSTFPWENVDDPLSLLDSLQGQPRWAWIDSDEAVVAWGRMAAIQGANLEGQLAQVEATFPGEEIRLFGGLPFDATSKADSIWGGFAIPNFILPGCIYRQTTQRRDLTIIHPASIIPQIPSPSCGNNAASLLGARLERLLSYPQWEAMVNAARQQAAAGQLQKVVLARALKVTFEHEPSLVTAFAHLVARYPGTYRFYFEPSPGHVFLGATPELLLQVQGKQLDTIALAGSAPRGSTPEEDRSLGADLLACPKNRREQAIVVERICDDLKPLCESFQFLKAPRLRQLPNIQHLETPITARLKRPGILTPAEALHPTPALAGQPRQVALAMLRQYEPVTRGAYGAPIGWVTPDGDGRLAVAIRSGIFCGRVGRLYAGSGILAESQPDKEWEETALKFRPMLEALGLCEDAV
ncbi:MAG: isochorismate synthase [Chloroflexota bacterium]